MIDATISCGRRRAMARLGRFQGSDGRFAAVAALRPRAASPRPGANDLMASII
jgi:hypothetical protein